CSSEVSELKTIFSELIPIPRRKPTQNWDVLHTFSTLGIPTRSCDRSLGGRGVSAEGFFSNHVCNVWKGILIFLDSSLDHFHFVHVFHEPFGTRIVHNDAFPPLGNRHLTPFTSCAADQCHIDKAALACYRAPVADRVF